MTPRREASQKPCCRPSRTARLRKVAELAPPEVISANPVWGHHLRDTADVAEASLDDLAWADAVLFGTPPRARDGRRHAT